MLLCPTGTHPLDPGLPFRSTWGCDTGQDLSCFWFAPMAVLAGHTVSLCSPGSELTMLSLDKTGLELAETHLSAGIKAMHNHA